MLLFGISGGGVPPASPNPDPISEQRMPFQTWPQKSIPVFGPTFDRLMFVVFVQTGNAFFVVCRSRPLRNFQFSILNLNLIKT